jgi:hypothetical protein
VVSYFDKKENCIKEDLYSNLVKSEDELDVWFRRQFIFKLK